MDSRVRVWHNKLKKYLPNDEWFLDFDGRLRFFNINDGALLTIHESGYVIQHFTGLFDQNGCEICEGDTLRKVWCGSEFERGGEYFGDVVFQDGSFKVRWKIGGALDLFNSVPFVEIIKASL